VPACDPSTERACSWSGIRPYDDKRYPQLRIFVPASTDIRTRYYGYRTRQYGYSYTLLRMFVPAITDVRTRYYGCSYPLVRIFVPASTDIGACKQTLKGARCSWSSRSCSRISQNSWSTCTFGHARAVQCATSFDARTCSRRNACRSAQWLAGDSDAATAAPEAPHARRRAIRSSAARTQARTHARTRACSVPSCAHIRADAGSSGRLERSEHPLLEHVQHIVRHMPCHVSHDTAWRRVTSNARYTLESRGTSCSLNTSTMVCHHVSQLHVARHACRTACCMPVCHIVRLHTPSDRGTRHHPTRGETKNKHAQINTPQPTAGRLGPPSPP
jgi:hypothetical protein